MQWNNRVAFAIAVAVAWWSCGAAFAQEAKGQQQSAAPQLNSDMFKVPYATPTYDLGPRPGTFAGGKIDFSKTDSDKTAPKPSLPNKVDLGKYQLELNVRHDDDRSRAALDSGETANLNSGLAAPDKSPKPNYFGLTLTAPTH